MIENRNEIFEILTKHIYKVFDESNNEVIFNNVLLHYEKRKHSSAYSLVLYIDGIPLSGKQMKTYKVEYICRCGKHNIILLQKYIGKQKIWCHACLQDRSFEDSLKTKPYEIKKGIRKQIRYHKDILFDDMDILFKDNYKKLHILPDEFFYYLPYIYRLNDIVLTDDIRKNIKYSYAEPCNNQFKFTSKISFDGINWDSIYDITFKCNTCGKIFKIHFQNIRNLNIHDIRCKTCNFTNYNYQIKLYNGSNITYQSLLEKDFLDKCFENNIKVINGFEIPYFWDNKLRTYITDFYLPDLKYIVEIKGNNIYYKKDIISGKLLAKNNAAEKFAINNQMKFKFVLDSELDNFISSLQNERYSLNNCESN